MQQVKAPWDGVALVCRKCGKKLGGGFGKKQKQDLSHVLRGAMKAAGRRRELLVVPVNCLGLCPKQAVAVVVSSDPGRVTVVPAGAGIEAILAALTLVVPPPVAEAEAEIPAPSQPVELSLRLMIVPDALRALKRIPETDAEGLVEAICAVAANKGNAGDQATELPGQPGVWRLRHGEYRALYRLTDGGIEVFSAGHGGTIHP